ncbi:MAG: gliding motility-associated C-terminal domain-containing protein [Bacteroidetes bacterium]|nr:gliding motility-associated C-terminal domain-containing protein [Bacteroidota bacterium]
MRAPQLLDTLTVNAFAGPDMSVCNKTPVQLGGPPRPGLVYKWSPAQGLSNPDIANPLANPAVTTRYVLTANNSGGGCLSTDTVTVNVSSLSDSVGIVGKAAYCIDSDDSAVLYVQSAAVIQWYKDNIPILGATQPRYRATQSGNYYAMLTDTAGCSIGSRHQPVLIDVPKPGIRYPIAFAVENLPLGLTVRNIGDSVVWHPPMYLDNPESYTPNFKGLFDQEYTIEIKSYTGCVTVDTQFVKTVKHVEILVPSGFTPNGDGANDYLRPILMGVKNMNYFRVYNRIGQLLFQSNNQYNGWDGRINGYTQPTQTVVWVIEALGVDGVLYHKKGTTVLIR